MTWILLLIPLNTFAHKPLTSHLCKNQQAKLKITQLKAGNYQILLPNNKKVESPAPEIRDHFDSKKKQLFDIFEFKRVGLKVVKPDTPGPTKVVIAHYKKQSFKCSKYPNANQK